MHKVIIRNATLGYGPDKHRADVACDDGVIVAVGKDLDTAHGQNAETIHAQGRALLPGFVDCHTHACWAGDRTDEWARGLAGESYTSILAAGGGIMATVRAVRAATRRALKNSLLERLMICLGHGTTAIEIKSGYGLTTPDELKMLQAISDAADEWPGEVFLTACIGHAIDPEQTDAVARTINETLPEVTRQFPHATIDAYCEHTAWSLKDCLALFDAAHKAGHSVRVHADQFTSMGMIPESIGRGYIKSVDHLEATTKQDLQLLAASDAFGVMLPASGFHLDDRYGDGRAFLDAGGKLCVATNMNPGSAPCASLQMAAAIAVRKLGVTPTQAICAITQTPAALLGTDAGAIEQGKRADLVLLRSDNALEIAYMFGANLVDRVWVAGEPA